MKLKNTFTVVAAGLALAALPLSASAQGWGHGWHDHGYGRGHDHFSFGLGLAFPASPPTAHFETQTAVVTGVHNEVNFEAKAKHNENVRSRLPVNVEVGDTVSLSGYRDDRVFYADHVQVIYAVDDAYFGPNFTVHVDFPGTITAILDSGRAEVRGGNGRNYQVETRQDIGPDLRVGAPVHVVGSTDAGGTSIRVTRLVLDQVAATPIEVDGVITHMDYNSPHAQIQLNDGTLFDIRFRDISAFHVGDHVHVRGQLHNNVIDVTDIRPNR